MSKDNIGDSMIMWEVQNHLDDAYAALRYLRIYPLATRVRKLANRVVKDTWKKRWEKFNQTYDQG